MAVVSVVISCFFTVDAVKWMFSGVTATGCASMVVCVW